MLYRVKITFFSNNIAKKLSPEIKKTTLME